MRGDLDLCTKKRGLWSIYRIYPANKQADALKDARYLKTEGTYDAVVLVDDDNRNILFSHTKSGGSRLRYGVLRKELKEASERKKVAHANGALANLYANRQSKAAPSAQISQQNKDAMVSLRVGLIGFGVTLLSVVGLMANGASFATTMIVFLLMGSLTLALTVWVHSLYNEPTPGKKEAAQQLQLQKKLKKSHEIFQDVFYLGKAQTWREENQGFIGDGHFALILYMLGMSQGFKNTLALPHGKTQQQIAAFFRGAGIAPESIANCANNLSEYLAYPKYHAVYQKGVADVHALHENPAHHISLQGILTGWYAPTPDTSQEENLSQLPLEEPSSSDTPVVPKSNFALVMFTDIVGSTERILQEGEAWMIDVLQAHNSIVREAIQAFNGHEVKHTGDGIMMSFPQVENGIKASIAIQKGVTLFNQQLPHRAFLLRIGMSAGEPTSIDSDLFGLPVNLAARVLPFANAHEVALSADCHALCQDLPYTFKSKEDCAFKGFDKPQTVYFLEWQDEAST